MVNYSAVVLNLFFKLSPPLKAKYFFQRPLKNKNGMLEKCVIENKIV